MFTDHIAVKRFAELQHEYGFDTLIETGTNLGVGTEAASQVCKRVATVELDANYREVALRNWPVSGYRFTQWASGFASLQDHRKHCIYSYLGSSVDLLPWVIGKFTDRPLCFYLDAHWPGTVIRKELEIIAGYGLSDSIIICHDFLVPGKEDTLRCDEYEGVKLSYDFVKDMLAMINPNYRIEYNSESTTGVGILYALPPR